MIFLDCPAYLDQDGTLRCGLPAEVTSRYTIRSTDGPLEAAMIRCPAGHWFNGPVESLTWEPENRHAPRSAGATSRAVQDSRQRAHDRPDTGSRPATRDAPAGPREVSRPATAPAYYLGRPASLWITVMRPRRNRTAPDRPIEATTGGANERHPGTTPRKPAADPAGKVPLTLASFGLPAGGLELVLLGGAAFVAWEHEQGRHDQPHLLCPTCWLNRIAPACESPDGTPAASGE